MAVMTAADLPPLVTADGAGLDWARSLTEHEPWLRRVILARTGEPQAVDEVWQQVALAAIEQRWPLTDASKAAPWLHRLAVVASARFRRQQGRARRAHAALADVRRCCASGPADPLGWLMRAERLDLTRQALLRLSGRDAEILLLKYGQRWSYRQIATRLGISEKAVDCRLLRARERLRQELTAMGIRRDDL
jgi:RNA polymerase sigma-70 factor (ECF subfamily)